MKAVIDTNIIISALIASRSLPAAILDLWRKERFSMLTCAEHLEELRRATRYPRVRSRVQPAVAGRLVNEVGKLGIFVEKLLIVERSRDHWDNYLLALAEAGSANFLVTGDKAGLLALGKHGSTKIVSVREFADLLKI